MIRMISCKPKHDLQKFHFVTKYEMIKLTVEHYSHNARLDVSETSR